MTQNYHPRLRRMWMRHRHWLLDTYLATIVTITLIVVLVKGW